MDETQKKNFEHVLHKIGYAPTDQGIENISKFFSYKDWIKIQLNNPNFYDDSFIKEKIKNYETENLNNFQLTLKYNSEPPPDQSPIIKEALNRRVYYSLYSENRLREMMVWFWFNHFNVYGDSGAFVYLKSFEDIFRNNPFGYFKDILKKVLFNPAMLTYSDNDLNTKPMFFNETQIGISDNLARNILEYYTLSDNQYYSENDTYQLSLILSGLKSTEEYNFFFNDGSKIYFQELKSFKEKNEYEYFFSKHPDFLLTKLFESYAIFFEEGHMQNDKNFLGHTIKNNSYLEIEEVLEIISNHPGTAKNICTKLSKFFLGENHNNTITQELIEVFLSTNGNMLLVLEKLLLSFYYEEQLEKRNTFKNPFEYFISTLKLITNNQNIEDFSLLESSFFNTSFGIQWKLTPEGYSLNSTDYITTNNLNQYINFSQDILNKENLNIGKNYFKMNPIELSDLFLSNIWLYR